MSEKATRNRERTRFVRGSRNVFADLDVAEPQDALARARLAASIADTISRRKLTQARAAELMGTDQGTVSKLVNGRIQDRFTQDRLIRYLRALGDSVEIRVHRPPVYRDEGRLTVITS